MRIITAFLVTFLLLGNAQSLRGLDLTSPTATPSTIDINNKVLLKVNGKSLSVVDVVKKLDLLFYKQLPEHISSPMIRYQFYATNWRTVFDSLVDEALIVADAEEKKIEVTEGDIREELESLFGPDVVVNIDRLNMSYDEAVELLKRELIVQRMMGMMVRSKAMNEVHPKDVRSRYKQKCQEFPPENQFVYQVLSIRGSDMEKRDTVAKQAMQLLTEQQVSFGELLAHLPQEEEGMKVSLSEEFHRKESELSLSYKAVLQTLAAGQHSSSQIQLVGNNKQAVSRIFFLKDKNKSKMAPFGELERELNQQLMLEVVDRHQDVYLAKLRQQYGVTKELLNKTAPKEFEPFSLR